jgi:hypothetical protein
MPETLPHIDQEVFAGIRQGNEQSLERVFRDSYPALVQEAKSKLLDAFAGSSREAR